MGSYTMICIVALAAWFLTLHTTSVSADCQLEMVKKHAYNACDYIAERMYDDHQRLMGSGRSRRNAAATASDHHHQQQRRHHGRRHHAEQQLAEADAAETTDTTTNETHQAHQHLFKRRYLRPTHLSIRHLSGAYLVMEKEYARIVRKHPSHRYKIMPAHYRNNNGTLQQVTSLDVDTAEVDSEQRSSAEHFPHSVENHRHHPVARMRTTSARAEEGLSTDELNASNEIVVSRRTRNAANLVAVSSCCGDIEKCMHMMCPLR